MKTLTLLLVCLATRAFTQTCFEGDCQNGYGKRDATGYLYVGSFYGGKLDGPGLRASKENGSVSVGYYAEGSPVISAVEFVDGVVQFGQRKKNEANGVNYLHNGFSLSETSSSKYIDGRKYPMEFNFDSNACLLGDCEAGFGAEFFSFVTPQKDTLTYLYTGNFKNGSWDGEGVYYEFSNGDYFVGKFLNGKEWTGGYFNHEQEISIYLVDGQEVKTMTYSIPTFNPPAAQQQTAANNTSQNRGGFWRSLGEVAGEVIVGAIDGASKAPAKKPTSGKPTGQLHTVKMYILNKTNREIQSIFVSSSNTDDWEDDILGDYVMMHGQGDWLTFNTSESTCFYDLKVTYSNGNSTTWKKLDVCTYTTFELKPNAVVLQGKD